MKGLFWLAMVVAGISANAQRQDANWVFGYNCGMEFGNVGPTNYYAPLNTFEAAATVSDGTGNLLFYVGPTNPVDLNSVFTIFFYDGTPINNGDSISIIETSTNGAVFLEIIPDSQYYLIHSALASDCRGITNLCYNTCMTAINRINNEWWVTQKNVILSDKVTTEKLAVTRHANGQDWWVVTQLDVIDGDSCTNGHLVFGISKDTVLVQLQNIGREWCDPLQFGEMVFSPSGTKLAAAIANDYYIRTYSFDRCNGRLGNYQDTILHSFRKAYSVAYSHSGEVLYATYGAESPPKGLAQIYYLNGYRKIEFIWNFSLNGTPGQLELAADGKIYLANYFSNFYIDDTVNKYLTVINYPDSIGVSCGLFIQGYYVGDSCRTRGGLPNMPNYNLGPLPLYMADAGMDTFYCAGDSTIKAFSIGGDSIYGITYEWQPAPGIDTLNNRTQWVVPPPQSRWYYVTLTDTNYVGPSCNSRIDSVFIEVRNCDTVGITETQPLQAKLYPNPTTGTLTVELPNGQRGNLELYNLLGQNVFNATINGTSTLKMDLPKGVYIYRIGQGGLEKMGRLVVE